MKSKNQKLGVIGETAVSLELMKKGYDVINLNNIYQNYKKADLICINPDTGKSVMIQVKTGTTTNIMCGFTSELDGTVPELEEKVIGPWIFVFVDEKDFSMKFYVLTKEETHWCLLKSFKFKNKVLMHNVLAQRYLVRVLKCLPLHPILNRSRYAYWDIRFCTDSTIPPSETVLRPRHDAQGRHRQRTTEEASGGFRHEESFQGL